MKYPNTKWLIQGAPITPHLNEPAVLSLTKGLERVRKGLGLSIIVTFFQDKGDVGNWTLDEECLYNRGKYLEEHPEVIHQLFNLWEEKVKTFVAFVKELEKNGIKDIHKQYVQFLKVYQQEYEIALVTEYFTVWSDVMMERILKTIPKEKHEQAQKLILPFKLSFMNEEELSALKTVTQEDVVRHQKKFYWINCGYKYATTRTVEEFSQSIAEAKSALTYSKIKERIAFLENYESIHAQKCDEIVTELKIAPNNAKALKLISKIAWMHDMRKKYNLMGSYWLNQFLLVGSALFHISHEQLQFTTTQEFIDLLEGKKIDVNVLSERMKGSAMINTSKDGTKIVYGKDFEELKKEILDISQQEIVDFRGMTASYGKVQGKVRIILNPARQKLQQGEILVASMTRPEYVPLMKKASAVITDEGGITSHAAIISRELGVPCIVGTRIATKVLKDGMKVEVNGNHGLVRILQK